MLCLSYLLEMSGGKWTTIVGVGIEFYWVTAWISLGALAFVLTDWRNLVLATSVPGLLIVAFFWLIPESPKWLYTVGRVEEAEAAVRKIAKFNGKTLPDDWRLEKKIQDKDGGTRATANVFDLFRNPHTCGKTLILYANWFICSLTYYGLTLNSSELGGDFHVNFMINGVLEIPAYGISMIAIGYLGRRIPYALSLALSGVSLLSLMFIPSHLTDLVVAVAILGKFFVTISFGIIYLYTSELFPTELRATGVGTSCFVSRIGGMAAGWVGLLTKYHVYLPTSIYGVSALVIAAMALALPETKGEKMPDTVEEGERMKLLLYPGEIVSGKKRIHSLPV
jgi:OCT family organic cation transporter-like MFS transporter 4/5